MRVLNPPKPGGGLPQQPRLPRTNAHGLPEHAGGGVGVAGGIRVEQHHQCPADGNR